jgi:hypothetical protein
MQTGQRVRPAQVEAQLKVHMETVEKVVREAGLPHRCLKAVAKAKRVLGAMVDTLAFFEKQVARRLQEALPQEVHRLVDEKAIAAAYLQLAASKASTAEERHRVAGLGQALLAQVQAAQQWLALTEEARGKLLRVATECAQVFQRASSCVEGRNGQLSLRHHSLHLLRPARLQALTTVHNYFLKRSDGTTAAQRFFGAKHPSLFAALLHLMSPPPRPAKRRSATPLH